MHTVQVVNARVPTRSYWSAVSDACGVTQQICVVVAAAAVPLQLRSSTLSVTSLLVADAALLILGRCLLTTIPPSAMHPIDRAMTRPVPPAAVVSPAADPSRMHTCVRACATVPCYVGAMMCKCHAHVLQCHVVLVFGDAASAGYAVCALLGGHLLGGSLLRGLRQGVLLVRPAARTR